MVDFRNGLLGDLDTIDKVQERAETYVTLARSDGKVTSQIFLCSEIPTKQSGNAMVASTVRKSKGNKGGKQAKNDREQTAKESNENQKKVPSEEFPCHSCGAIDHWANKCPHKDSTDEKEQTKVKRGKGFYTFTSMVIPHDNMDAFDIREDYEEMDENILLSEVSVKQSEIKLQFESSIIAAAADLPKNYICLDTCGSASLFNNANLINNIREANYSLVVDGIQSNSEPVIASKIGDTIFGCCYRTFMSSKDLN
jgi:hypothetical protein